MQTLQKVTVMAAIACSLSGCYSDQQLAPSSTRRVEHDPNQQISTFMNREFDSGYQSNTKAVIPDQQFRVVKIRTTSGEVLFVPNATLREVKNRFQGAVILGTSEQ